MAKQTRRRRGLTEHRSYALDAMHNQNIDPHARELFLLGEDEADFDPCDGFPEPGVEFRMSNRLIKNLRFLTLDNLDPILIHMKTCGGDWIEGMAIYDAIRTCPCYVTILSYTHARSMSSVILQAADKRVLMPSSYFLFHYGTISYTGDARAVRSQAEWEKTVCMPAMLDVYIERLVAGPGKLKGEKPEVVREWLESQMEKHNDVFFTADQAVSYGFADEIFDGDWEGLTG